MCGEGQYYSRSVSFWMNINTGRQDWILDVDLEVQREMLTFLKLFRSIMYCFDRETRLSMGAMDENQLKLLYEY